MTTAGDRIKYLRESANLSQLQLAKLLSTSRATVNGWETGANLPGFMSIYNLAKLFNVSSDFILGLKNEETISLDSLDNESKNALRQLVRCLKYKSNLKK